MKLENARLSVTFAECGRIDTQRFDSTAIVTGVILDGKYEFCVPEQVLSHRKTTNGVGLCGEFVLDGPAEEAKAGEWFVKPGVGLLQQSEDNLPYNMWRRYEEKPFPVTAELCENTALFRQHCTVQNGWGIDIEKRFTLDENRLILDYSVKNSGEKACLLKEYQHNFVSLAGEYAQKGYRLSMPCNALTAEYENGRVHSQTTGEAAEGVLSAEGTDIVWQKDLEGLVLYHRGETILPDAPRYWKLSLEGSPVTMTEETDFTPTRIDVWAPEHCISAEYYQTVSIAPGETARWRRTWIFED